MKRVRVKFLAPNEFDREDFLFAVKGVLEVEEFSENKINKDDIIESYSFEELWEYTKDFANGVWMAMKGFVGMMGWAVVLIITGIKWMWKAGAGSKEARK